MKIAFVISGMGKGGGERVVSVFSNYFAMLGNEVSIIITGQNDECAYNLNSKVRVVDFNEWRKNNPQNKKSFVLRTKKKLRKSFANSSDADKMFRDYKYLSDYLVSFFQKNHIDFAVSFLVYDNMSLALCSKRQKTRIAICEGTFPDRPEYSKTFKQVRNKCYAHADIRVFQTKYQSDCFPKRFKKNSTVIGNPIPDNLPVRSIKEPSKTIVNFCRLDKPKNLFLLFDSFSLLSKDHTDYELKIFGEGPLYHELLDYIQTLGLSDRIQLCPFDNRLHDKIKDCAMFVTSSDYEGLSNSLMEAMAMGMPAIATDCLGGGAKSLIIDGENGLLVPRGDKEKLYLAMKKYIEDPDFAEKCGKNACSIREEYSVDTIAKKWLALMDHNM